MNASKVRAIERFDVAKKNAKALRKLTLLLSSVTTDEGEGNGEGGEGEGNGEGGEG